MYFGHRPWDVYWDCALVDFSLETTSALLAFLRILRDRHCSHRRKLAFAAPLVCTLRTSRIGYTSSAVSHAPSRSCGTISLRSQPNVGRRDWADPRAGIAPRQSHIAVLWDRGWLAFHTFMKVYEESTLRRTHAAEYEEFCRNAPRWITQLSAWRSGDQDSSCFG